MEDPTRKAKVRTRRCLNLFMAATFSGHTFVNCPAREMKKKTELNWILGKSDFDLRKVPRNATPYLSRGVAVLDFAFKIRRYKRRNATVTYGVGSNWWKRLSLWSFEQGDTTYCLPCSILSELWERPRCLSACGGGHQRGDAAVDDVAFQRCQRG